MEILENANYAKKRKEFNCINCDFTCFNKYDYQRHERTDKHKYSLNGNKMELLENANYANYALSYFCDCKKDFKTNRYNYS